MASPEVALQIDLFTGELVDNRSRYQKKKDFERAAPQQILMFSTPDVVQFGQNPKSAYQDWIDQATLSPLILAVEDKRTPEEIERDLIREAEKLTIPLFEEVSQSPIPKSEAPCNSQTTLLSGVIFDAQVDPAAVGLPTLLRAKSIPVQSRYKRKLPTK